MRRDPYPLTEAEWKDWAEAKFKSHDEQLENLEEDRRASKELLEWMNTVRSGFLFMGKVANGLAWVADQAKRFWFWIVVASVITGWKLQLHPFW